jgi:hypothetical protein
LGAFLSISASFLVRRALAASVDDPGFVPPCGVNFTALTGAPTGAAFACERVWIRMLVQMLVAHNASHRSRSRLLSSLGTLWSVGFRVEFHDGGVLIGVAFGAFDIA